MNVFRMAWRNLWRSRRRTLITIASVFFAVFFAVVMRSLQLGAYDHMFRNVIESYTGYVQIQDKDFADDRSVDNSFSDTPELRQKIDSNDNVISSIPRFETFALASSGMLTKGVLVLGIDPVKEKMLSDVEERLVRYRLTGSAIDSLEKFSLPSGIKEKLKMFAGNSWSSTASLLVDIGIPDKDSSVVLPLFRRFASFKNGYIKTGEAGALVGDKLAVFLEAGIGDTIVLLGQGFHGSSAAGKYVIRGIVKLPSPELDNKIVYLPCDIAQSLCNAEGRLTSLALAIKKNDDNSINSLVAGLQSKLGPDLKVLGWREMNKLIINQMDADSKSGGVMIFILYLVIAFGVFGTVLMMTAERRREFGVLVAVGMQKTRLAAVFATEMIYMGFLGIISGVLASLPVLYYGHAHPVRFRGEMAKMYEDYGMEAVMPFLLPDTYVLWQSLVVSVIVLIALIYPMRKISKMIVVNSLKA